MLLSDGAAQWVSHVSILQSVSQYVVLYKPSVAGIFCHSDKFLLERKAILIFYIEHLTTVYGG